MPRKRPVYLLGAVAGIIVLAVLIGLAPDIAEWYRTWRMTPEELLEQTAWTSPQAIDEEGALISYSSILVSLRLAGKEDASSGFSEETLEFHRQRPGQLVSSVGGSFTIYPEFNPGKTGCHLVAVDQGRGRLIWRSSVKGMGQIKYLGQYHNHVAVRRDHPRYITVFGDESAGRYVEIVDFKTGKTVAHRLEPMQRRLMERL